MIVSFSYFHLFKVSVWCKQGIFGRKVLLGEVHIALGSLNLSIKQVAWYKLFIDCHLSDGDWCLIWSSGMGRKINVNSSIVNVLRFFICANLECEDTKLGVMNGPLKFLTARKILPFLDVLAKFKRVLACSCCPNFCSCSQARFLVSIARNFVNPSLG